MRKLTFKLLNIGNIEAGNCRHSTFATSQDNMISVGFRNLHAGSKDTNISHVPISTFCCAVITIHELMDRQTRQSDVVRMYVS